jgi:hypothetical protein
MNPHELEQLRFAKSLLESKGMAARFAILFEIPIEKGIKMLPPKWSGVVNRAIQKALATALKHVVSTFNSRQRHASGDGIYKMIVSSIGACAGVFGLPALILELPVTTTLMIRSILDIARSEGADICDPKVHLECIQVFAFGKAYSGNTATDSGYFAVRAALAKSLTGAAQHVTEEGMIRQGTPVLIRFISQISARFGAVVSEKLAAQAVPVIGAAGGAAINAIFIDYFQKMARGHFIIRRLESQYGEKEVQDQYDMMDLPGKPKRAVLN